MFSIKFIKFQPTTYVLQYKSGIVKGDEHGTLCRGRSLAYSHNSTGSCNTAVTAGLQFGSGENATARDR